jgi:hypothetical protein
MSLPLFGQSTINGKKMTVKVHMLIEQNTVILDIKNNTDSILIFNSREPLSRVKESICFIDMGLTNLNGSLTFLEPSNLSRTYFTRVLPRRSKSYSFLVQNIDGDTSNAKSWHLDFHYFYLPVDRVLNDGKLNYELVEILCEEGIGIYRSKGVLVLEKGYENLCFRELIFVQNDITFHELNGCKKD